MINDRDFKQAWEAGWEAAVNAHSGVVAAAERVVAQYIKSEDIPQSEVARSIITLASAVDNLKTTLKIGLDFS